jgi:hypothetical protein
MNAPLRVPTRTLTLLTGPSCHGFFRGGVAPGIFSRRGGFERPSPDGIWLREAFESCPRGARPECNGRGRIWRQRNGCGLADCSGRKQRQNSRSEEALLVASRPPNSWIGAISAPAFSRIEQFGAENWRPAEKYSLWKLWSNRPAVKLCSPRFLRVLRGSALNHPPHAFVMASPCCVHLRLNSFFFLSAFIGVHRRLNRL